MKLAILIGVSQYDKTSNLPACKADVTLMTQLLEKTGNYDEVLSIDNKTQSSAVKRTVSDWIKRHKDEEIEEVFFYYTGHGFFQSDEFFYCLSDFDTSRPSVTGITNSEVDDWLRTLEPGLAVKVIDACRSGVQYVKDSAFHFINKYEKGQANTFKKCYFLFSSQNDQLSYQDHELSFFTRAFAEAVRDHGEQTIRYRDIIDFTSDYFSSRGDQVPQFVMQADSTEEFCAISEELRQFLEGYAGLSSTTPPHIDPTKETTPNKSEESEESLEAIIRKDAQLYATEDEITTLLESIKEKVTNFGYIENLLNLYETNSFFEHGKLINSKSDYENGFPKVEQIGEWLSKRDHEYFAHETYRTEVYTTKVPVRLSYLGYEPFMPRTETEERTKKVISGLKITSSFSFDTIRITAEPRLLNLVPFECTVVLLISKRKLRCFYFYGRYRELNWKDRELQTNINWLTSASEIKTGEVWRIFEEILRGFEQHVLESTRQRFAVGDNSN